MDVRVSKIKGLLTELNGTMEQIQGRLAKEPVGSADGVIKSAGDFSRDKTDGKKRGQAGKSVSDNSFLGETY